MPYITHISQIYPDISYGHEKYVSCNSLHQGGTHMAFSSTENHQLIPVKNPYNSPRNIPVTVGHIVNILIISGSIPIDQGLVNVRLEHHPTKRG